MAKNYDWKLAAPVLDKYGIKYKFYGSGVNTWLDLPGGMRNIGKYATISWNPSSGFYIVPDIRAFTSKNNKKATSSFPRGEEILVDANKGLDIVTEIYEVLNQ